MQRVSSSKVICYFANPVTNKVEKHEMTSVTFEEASRPKILMKRGRPHKHINGEEHLWSLEPPKGTKVEDIVDLTPVPFDVKIMDSVPPPALQRDHLRERAAARG